MRLKLDDLRRAVTTEESNDMVQNYHENYKTKAKIRSLTKNIRGCVISL